MSLGIESQSWEKRHQKVVRQPRRYELEMLSLNTFKRAEQQLHKAFHFHSPLAIRRMSVWLNINRESK